MLFSVIKKDYKKAEQYLFCALEITLPKWEINALKQRNCVSKHKLDDFLISAVEMENRLSYIFQTAAFPASGVMYCSNITRDSSPFLCLIHWRVRYGRILFSLQNTRTKADIQREAERGCMCWQRTCPI